MDSLRILFLRCPAILNLFSGPSKILVYFSTSSAFKATAEKLDGRPGFAFLGKFGGWTLVLPKIEGSAEQTIAHQCARRVGHSQLPGAWG